MMELGFLFWALAVAGVLLTGISKSGFAGGAGVVAVPLMALYIPVSQAIVIMLPLLLLMDARTISYYWRSADQHLLKALIPAAMGGIAIGGLLLGWMEDAILELLLGLVSVLFASWQHLAPKLASFRGSAWLWSGVSGLTSTLIHAGGPPINIYMLSRGLPKVTWLATTAVFFGTMNLVKIIPYSLNQQWSGDVVLIAICLIPVSFLGVWLGKQAQERISEEIFVKACRVLLFASGTMLMIKALVS